MYLRLLLRCSVIAVALAAGVPLAAADGARAAGKGLLGVAVANPSPPSQGALVARVAPESAAARAGLRPQDLIVQADSQPIFSASDLTAYGGNPARGRQHHAHRDALERRVARARRGQAGHAHSAARPKAIQAPPASARNQFQPLQRPQARRQKG